MPPNEGRAEVFAIDGARIEIPSDQLNDRLRQRLTAGLYERHERALTQELLRPGDRVLDLGAGAGLVAITAARIVGPENLTVVEANPAMIRPLRRNLRRNLPEMPRVIKGAVVGDDHQGDTVTLSLGAAFWASAIGVDRPQSETVEVPAKRFSRLVRARDATVVIMDIEGAERHILTRPLPASLRLLIAELHPRIYGPDADAAIAAALAQGGWHRVGAHRDAEVVAFARDGG